MGDLGLDLFLNLSGHVSDQTALRRRNISTQQPIVERKAEMQSAFACHSILASMPQREFSWS
jgi:hypothetical protein